MRNRKFLLTVGGLCLLAVCVILLSQFVSIGMASPLDSYGAISIAFDRQQMRSVDKIVLRSGEQVVEITEGELLKAVVSETMVATHINVNCTEDRSIELYAGDTLVRSMIWSTCCDTVRVYDADEAHWMLTLEWGTNGGCVYLSSELASQLNALLVKDI